MIAPNWIPLFLWDKGASLIGYGDGMEVVRLSTRDTARDLAFGLLGLIAGRLLAGAATGLSRGAVWPAAP